MRHFLKQEDSVFSYTPLASTYCRRKSYS